MGTTPLRGLSLVGVGQRRQQVALAGVALASCSLAVLLAGRIRGAWRAEARADDGRGEGTTGKSLEYSPADSESDDKSHDFQDVAQDDAQLCCAGARKKSKRPCKGKRRRYKNLVARIEDSIRADPTKFDLADLERNLPSSVLKDTRSRDKLMSRLAALLQRELDARSGGLAASPSSGGCSGTPQVSAGKPAGFESAAFWDDAYRDNVGPREWYVGYDALRPWCQRVAPLGEGGKVLVLGVGSSEVSLQLYDDGYLHVVGVDLSQEAVWLADALIGDRPIRNVIDDARSLQAVRQLGPFDLAVDKGTFDAVAFPRPEQGRAAASRALRADTSQQAMDTPSLLAALRAVHGVLRPGGVLLSVAAVPQPEDFLQAAAAVGRWDVLVGGEAIGPPGGGVHVYALRTAQGTDPSE